MWVEIHHLSCDCLSLWLLSEKWASTEKPPSSSTTAFFHFIFHILSKGYLAMFPIWFDFFFFEILGDVLLYHTRFVLILSSFFHHFPFFFFIDLIEYLKHSSGFSIAFRHYNDSLQGSKVYALGCLITCLMGLFRIAFKNGYEAKRKRGFIERSDLL